MNRYLPVVSVSRVVFPSIMCKKVCIALLAAAYCYNPPLLAKLFSEALCFFCKASYVLFFLISDSSSSLVSIFDISSSNAVLMIYTFSIWTEASSNRHFAFPHLCQMSLIGCFRAQRERQGNQSLHENLSNP